MEGSRGHVAFEFASRDASIVTDDGQVAAWFDTPARILAATDEATALQVLDPTERERCSAFRFDGDRRAYLAVHTLHRQIWAKALDRMPQDVRVDHDSQGRPTIVGPDGASFFTSLSRRRGMVAVAISRGGSVGVDVEEATAGPEAMALLSQFLGASSYASVSREMDSDAGAFGRTWTLVEAFAKARGDGLTDSLRAIELSRRGDGRYKITDNRMSCLAQSVSPDPEHWGAIAWQTA